MKNLFKTIIVSAGIVSMTSCADFLDQSAPSEQTGGTVFESTYYTRLAINKLYGGLTSGEIYGQYLPIHFGTNTDCELIDGLGTEATNTTSERGNMNYYGNPGWGNLSRFWDNMYSIVENANLTIEGIEGSSLAEAGGEDGRMMQRFKGEALTVRALVYFELTRLFGDVPLKLESSKPDLSNTYLEKTDRDQIMDQLITDLKAAVELLPWADEVSGYTTERVTKGFAHALLANIALTRGGWSIRESAKEGYITASENSDPTYPTQRCDDATRKELYELALQHLSAVITKGTHKMNPSVKNQWYLLNQLKLDQTYRENIFEIPMGLSVTSELGYTIGVRINGASAYYGEKGNSSGKQKLTAPYFWSFDKNDERRDITCAHVQLKETNEVMQESTIGNTPFGIYVGKWDVRTMSEAWRIAAIAAGSAKWMTGINVVRMRYPQVLLMYAEVMNELAGPDGAYEGSAGITARKALEEVHTRAFADSHKAEAKAYVDALSGDKEVFFQAIVDENAWELAGEGFRKFDLIRWNLLSKKIDQMKADYVRQLNEYPAKIYFNYSDAAKSKIDMSSITWYTTPADPTVYQANATFFGAELTATTQTQLKVNLPSISAGLNATVKNRYLLPLASTTISASNGKLHNSYGYND